MADITTESIATNPRGFGGKPDPEPELSEEGQEPATPEEQMLYDLLVIRSRKIIFGDGKEKILTLLGSGQSPSQAMGQAGAMILKSLVDSGRQAGQEIDTGIVINAGAEVVDDLNELAKKNNVFQYDSPQDEEREVTDAMMWGAKYYGDGQIANGEITPEMQQMAKKEVEDGLAKEGAPRQTQVAAGVNQAMQPSGIIGNEMGDAS